jgi:iron complex transport system ATP-binding protein
VLKVVDVSFSYGRMPALVQVNLEIHDGEFVGIIGPNGSGKSTLLKIMSKILRPARGKVYVGGADLAELNYRELARRMAVASAELHFEFPFSVLDIALMGRTPHLGRFQRERAEDVRIARQALARTSASYLEGRYIHELSSGERQRVILAQALAQEPKILLLDEPTAHLDINHELEIFDLLRELNCKQQLTIVTVLHDLNLAAEYCQRLVLLKEGTIYKAGAPGEVITAEAIAGAYGADVLVAKNPATGAPHVHLAPRRR